MNVPRLVLALALTLSSATADAQAPMCTGTDPVSASRSLAQGDRGVERAIALVARDRHRQAREAYEAALAAYDATCSAGSDVALERRAIPLVRLGRALEAIASLDAFVRAHPLETLSADDRARIEANMRAIERDVATLRVSSNPPGQAFIAGAHAGETPLVLRFAAGPVDIEVRREGYETAFVRDELVRGEIHERTVELRAVAAPLSTEPPDRRASEAPPVELGHEATPPVASDPDLFLPWAAASTAAAVALLAGSIAPLAWALDRHGAFDGNCFVVPDPSAVPGCPAVVSDYNLGVGLAAAGFVVGGVLAVTAIVLWITHAATPSFAASTQLDCEPGSLGISCAF